MKMRKIFVVSIFLLISSFVYAAPFGLKMGMTIAEIAQECEEYPAFVEEGIYSVTPLKKHPLFSTYYVYVHDNVGLYQIWAISDSITCNKYGTELQNAFNNVKDRISKTYGTPRVINKVDPAISSFLQEDEYWFLTLKEGSRQLSAIWGERVELVDDLFGVILTCIPESKCLQIIHSDMLSMMLLDCITELGYLDGRGRLVLAYSFSNAQSVEDEQDEVF